MTETTVPMHSSSTDAPEPSRLATLLLWLAAGVILVLCARLASVSRTQEARVLETAREMLGKPFVDWMIPHTNGEIRLHKPPLAYWLSAGAFKVLGISAWSGRLPAVIAGWATLGFTYAIGKRLFDRAAALFAAAALIGSYLFFKSTLLAETDILATAFVTAGVYGILRATEQPGERFGEKPGEKIGEKPGEPSGERSRTWAWQHFIGLCIGAAVLAKGPPAAYLALFYVVICAMRKDWRPLGEFFRSGAFVTAAVIGVPWFVYVAQHVGSKQLIADLKNSAEGGKGHAGWPHVYIPMFAESIAPWTAVWAVAIVAALRHVGRRLRPFAGVDSVFTLLLWGLVIGLPLMGWGNKQIHYLLPLMPPTMILVGYGASGAIRGRGRFGGLSRVVLVVTGGALALLPLVPPLVARLARPHGQIAAVDWLACGILVVVSSLAFWLARNTGRYGIGRAAAMLSVALVITIAWESRVTDAWPTQDLAHEMYRVHPRADFVFRNEPSLSMSFEMGRIIPALDDAALTARMDKKNLICLERDESDPKSDPPPGWAEEGRIGQKGKWLRVFVPDVPQP